MDPEIYIVRGGMDVAPWHGLIGCESCWNSSKYLSQVYLQSERRPRVAEKKSIEGSPRDFPQIHVAAHLLEDHR